MRVQLLLQEPDTVSQCFKLTLMGLGDNIRVPQRVDHGLGYCHS
jgi:hypothetical protein